MKKVILVIVLVGMFLFASGTVVIATSFSIKSTVDINPILVFNTSNSNETITTLSSNSFTYVAASYSKIYISKDNKTWVTFKNPKHIHKIKYFCKKYVGLYYADDSTNGTCFSSDGANWSYYPLKGFLNDFTYAAKKFVVVGDAGVLYTSNDGVKWSGIKTTVYGGKNLKNFSSVNHNGKAFFAIAYNEDIVDMETNSFGMKTSKGIVNTIFKSIDGKKWTPTRLTFGGDSKGLWWTGKRFISYQNEPLYEVWEYLNMKDLIGYKNRYMTSLDGAKWVDFKMPNNNFGIKSHAGITFFACQPSSTGNLLISPDGIRWMSRSCSVNFNTFDNIYRTKYGFHAIGSKGIYFFSPVLQAAK